MVLERNFEVLKTNLHSGICAAAIKTIFRQNKKGTLLEFLFGSKGGRDYSYISSTSSSDTILEETIKNLQNQLNSFHERGIHLENQNLVKEKNLNVLSENENIRFKRCERSEQADYNLKVKKDDSRISNQTKVR